MLQLAVIDVSKKKATIWGAKVGKRETMLRTESEWVATEKACGQKRLQGASQENNGLLSLDVFFLAITKDAHT